MLRHIVSHTDSEGSSGGFTLIEAVISMVIVAVMLAAALSTLGSAAKNRQLQAQLQIGPALAHDLMAQILQAPYEEPDDTPVLGIEGAEDDASRADFDDVDDYRGWSASPPETTDGGFVPNADGWTRSVAVDHVSVSNPTTVSATDTGLKRITVTVTDPQGKTTTLTALRSRYGAYDQVPAVDTTIISAVDIQLQVSDDTSTLLTSGTSLLNWPAPPAFFIP